MFLVFVRQFGKKMLHQMATALPSFLSLALATRRGATRSRIIKWAGISLDLFGWHRGCTKTMLGATARPGHGWVPESVWHPARLLRWRLEEEGEAKSPTGRQWEVWTWLSYILYALQQGIVQQLVNLCRKTAKHSAAASLKQCVIWFCHLEC